MYGRESRNRKYQIAAAAALGKLAFKIGITTPRHDIDLNDFLLKGRKVTQTPRGEASMIEILDAWSKGWAEAKQAALKTNEGVP